MRTATVEFSMSLVDETDFLLLILPAASYDSEETLRIALDGEPIAWEERSGAHGTRELALSAGAGTLDVALHARIAGAARCEDDADPSRYLEDSKYVEASALRTFVAERFGALEGWDAVAAMRHWVAGSFRYLPSLSGPDDSAVMTLEKRGGMCRDYAHVLIGLARAHGIPARYTGVFAPALRPADFHAVAEVHLDGAWWVVDATGLAPRRSFVRIATGADAFETAWSTNWKGFAKLTSLRVEATDDALPADAMDDASERLQIR